MAGLDLGGQELASGDSERDVARGRDATVLTIGRVLYPASDALMQEPRLEVVEHRSWVGEAHDRLFGALVDLLRGVWRVKRVAVDATGLGETMARLLASALGSDAVTPVKFTSEGKSRLGYNVLAAVNGGRLKTYAGDGSAEYRQFWREMELARVAYRANQTMNFFVDPSEGHDDYLVSLALVVEAASGARPRAARGRVRGEF